jgi:hypothetical protein
MTHNSKELYQFIKAKAVGNIYKCIPVDRPGNLIYTCTHPEWKVRVQ